MRLWQHEDFGARIRAAEVHFARRGIPAFIIEKDYFVTECLRAAQQELGDAAVFKGGTSLSKGWRIIDRFSEDIDLFIEREAVHPPLGTRSVRARVRRIAHALARELPLRRDPVVAGRLAGPGRRERFTFTPVVEANARVDSAVVLEAGTVSGREPTVTMPIRSLLAEYLLESSESLGASDEAPFTMRLLDFRRTFVEKLFAINQAVSHYLNSGRRIGIGGRHYYDLARLGSRPEIASFVRSDEYPRIILDCAAIGRAAFAARHVEPSGGRFRDSPALFPSAELGRVLRDDYESQCAVLCFGPYPSWKEVLERFESLREWL